MLKHSGKDFRVVASVCLCSLVFDFPSHLAQSKKHLAHTLMPLILHLWILTLPLCYIIDDKSDQTTKTIKHRKGGN